MSTEKETHKQSYQEYIYTEALRRRFIRLGEVKDIIGKEATSRMILWRLTHQGKLVRVKEGLYAAIPPERVGSDYELDRYLLVDKAMRSEGSIAFHSALDLHGVANSAFARIYYLSKKEKRPFVFQGIEYRIVKAKELFGITTMMREGIKIPVTDKERTFLDCIRRPDLCGGLEEYLKSVEGFTLMDPIRLMDHLQRFGERSLYNRAGFILNMLKDRIRVDETMLDVLRQRITSSPCYLVPGGRGGKLVKEYNVIVPDNIGEMMRFV